MPKRSTNSFAARYRPWCRKPRRRRSAWWASGRVVPGWLSGFSITLHRDDYAERGLSSTVGVTRLPFEVEGRHIVLVDDVLYTGRTIRAALNELFDFGRPARVSLAVLVDRGGRELPVEAHCAAARLTLPASQRLSLAQDAQGRLTFAVEGL